MLLWKRGKMDLVLENSRPFLAVGHGSLLLEPCAIKGKTRGEKNEVLVLANFQIFPAEK